MVTTLEKTKMHSKLAANGSGPWSMTRWVNDFGRDESGALTHFTMTYFMMILLVGGVGVDVMRAETARTNLQHTLDRAVLAASDLDQTLDAQAVVTDYFTKAGLAEHLTSITVDEGIGYRVVSATASYQLDTQLMHLSGVDTLHVPASGTAEERIDGVEISLVLDVSGSMGWNNRLENLKDAAHDFIDTVSDASEDGKLSISIVPYATQVTVGETLLDQYNVTSEHNYSHCVNFEDSDFTSTSLSTEDALQRTDHFDVFTYTDTIGDDSDGWSMPVCTVRASAEILPLSKDVATLKAAITALRADANTSIDIGMKWGAALLDPGTQGVVANLIVSGDIHSDFSGRPSAHDATDTLKVLVLMTDGQNTSQYFLQDQYKTGMSDVWINTNNADRISVYDADRPGNRKYYRLDLEEWRVRPAGFNNGRAYNLSYLELWDRYSVAQNLIENYTPMMGWQDWATWYTSVFYADSYITKNARLDSICDAAKAQGIIVFTVAFEAPAGGRAVLSSCASSDSHYFDVSGTDISDAFSSIASSIRKLRLTN